MSTLVRTASTSAVLDHVLCHFELFLRAKLFSEKYCQRMFDLAIPTAMKVHATEYVLFVGDECINTGQDGLKGAAAIFTRNVTTNGPELLECDITGVDNVKRAGLIGKKNVKNQVQLVVLVTSYCC